MWYKKDVRVVLSASQLMVMKCNDLFSIMIMFHNYCFLLRGKLCYGGKWLAICDVLNRKK